MVGLRFTRLVVTALHSKDSNYNKRWLCICDCGKEHVVLHHHLKNKHVQSCGCLQEEQNKATKTKATKERRSYTKSSHKAMVNRCTNPRAPAWHRYGAKGITVCDRWLRGEGGLTGWECFYKDMGPRPEKHSIDRINGTKGYYPKNCRWATQEEQMENRTFKGKSTPLA